MFETFRNLLRHKGRTAMTILGIVIGIFAITVMGSLTEYFNALIGNAMQMAGNSITVTAKSGIIHATLTEGDRRAIERVPGVKAVFAEVQGALEPGSSGVSLGPGPTVIAYPPEYFEYDKLDLRKGRAIQRGDVYQAVIGSKIAKKKNLDLGGTLKWRDQDFTVVGILNETQTAPDDWVMVPLETARHVMERPTLISAFTVFPQDIREADAVVERIRSSVDTVSVQTLEEQLSRVSEGLAIFNVILLSGAIISVLVGGLAVINTMIMSVNERTHEIGLKKAIGATDGEIVREYVGEAALIGLLGGVIGFILGSGMTRVLNAAVGDSLGATDPFLLTPRLALIAIGFAVVLGAGAGLYPAWNAARLNPIEALRTE
ncbi:MAG: ABC transporter permease [Rudaea sp.]